MAALVAAAMSVVLAASGCSSLPTSTVVPAGTEDPAARAYVLDSLVDRASAQDGEWIENSLDDLLPSHTFSIDGKKASPLAEGIVIGTVASVEQGRGYMIEGDDAADGTEIPFADPRSLWRVIVLTVKTDTRLGDVKTKSIKVGVVIDGGMDVVQARDGYLSLGRVALVLNAPGKFAFDSSLYSIRQSGALLGLVSKSGEIRFPALGAESDEFVGDVDTVNEVVADSTSTEPVTELQTEHGEFTQSDE